MIVVTGHKGFIGSHLFDKLNAFGVEFADCFSFLLNMHRMNNIECVYHMGAISSTTETDLQKLQMYNINYSIKLFENCIKMGIPVKYASSASVYGNSDRHSINPLNQYAISKATVDYWVQDNIQKFKSIQGFRFYNVYGNGEDHKGTQASPITQFRKQAKDGKIKIFEGSSIYERDFVCVEDVVDIMINNDNPSGIYDVGTSKPTTFKKVAELVQKKYGGEIETIPFPDNLRAKYQYSTCAIPDFKYKYKSVEEWLHENSSN